MKKGGLLPLLRLFGTKSRKKKFNWSGCRAVCVEGGREEGKEEGGGVGWEEEESLFMGVSQKVL